MVSKKPKEYKFATVGNPVVYSLVFLGIKLLAHRLLVWLNFGK